MHERRGSGPPNRRAELDRHLVALLDAAPADRRSALATLRASDPLLAGEVEELLRLSAVPDPRLEPAAIVDGPLWRALRDELAAGEDEARGGIAPGDRIGAYRVLREIGRGGMATVYLAERADGQFEGRVALKVLWTGRAAADLAERFEQERQILASLRHPHIAALFDAGFDPRGFSYIVLEHVVGRPVTTYCDEERLGLDGRLALFVQVCKAVLHAHRSFVVHRDLKPSNILVTDEGQVKLLDFGIAKMLDSPRAGACAVPTTRTLVRVMTPEYASPEQVRGEPITAATDVYQLGLVLFELLTGQRAQSVHDDPDGVPIERVICERDPPRAAAVLRRVAAPPVPPRRADGDIDAIVGRALRKDPRERYPSPAQLLADLERYHARRPVQARAGSRGYVVRKFVSRHAWSLAAGAMVLLLVTTYLATMLVQARRTAREAARTEQVKNFLLGLFTAANPGNSKGAAITARELLDQGRDRIERDLSAQPALQAEMLTVLGEIYNTLGAYPDAIRALTRARALQEGAGDSLPSARTARWLAVTLHFSGRYAEAEPLLVRALSEYRALLAPDDWRITDALAELGSVRRSRGRLIAAETTVREALALEMRRRPPAPLNRATPHRVLGDVLTDRGDWSEAERHYREAISLLRHVYGDPDPQVAMAEEGLGRLLLLKGNVAAAGRLLESTARTRERLYGNDHPIVGRSLGSLALLRVAEGRPAEAVPLADRALAMYRERLGPDHPALARALLERALVDLAEHAPAAALARLDEVYRLLARAGLDGHPTAADAWTVAGTTLAAAGREDEGRAALRWALRIRQELSVPSDPRLATLREALAAPSAGISATR